MPLPVPANPLVDTHINYSEAQGVTICQVEMLRWKLNASRWPGGWNIRYILLFFISSKLKNNTVTSNSLSFSFMSASFCHSLFYFFHLSRPTSTGSNRTDILGGDKNHTCIALDCIKWIGPAIFHRQSLWNAPRNLILLVVTGLKTRYSWCHTRRTSILTKCTAVGTV